MWWKKIFGTKSAAKSTPEPATDVDPGEVMKWALDSIERHRDLLPPSYIAILPNLAAWYAIPVFIALKHKGFGTVVGDGLLEDLDAPLAAAIMAFAFADQADDAELVEVGAAMQMNLRHFILFWLAAFENFEARKTFSDSKLLAKMLEALIRNPAYGLEDTFHLSDDEGVSEFSAAVAAFICRCHGDMGSLDDA